MTTETEPLTLSAYLHQRLDEDEAELGVLIAMRDEGAGPNGIGWAEVGAIGEVLMISHRRALATVAAHRRIVELHAEDVIEPGICRVCDEPNQHGDGWPCPTLLALAQPYAGRDGWREEWAL